VPLVLVDLDNTLIDRAGAFDRWAQGFVAARGGDAGDAAWLVVADRDGLEPRERFAGMIAERFGLDAQDEGAILAELRGGIVRDLVTDDAVILALCRARAAGWGPFVVTNGTVEQQGRKLRHTGLDREVGGWSSAVNLLRVQASRARRQNSSVIASYSRSRLGRPTAFSGTCSRRLRSRARSARNAGSSSW
jgi:phosphoserine phosphatase